MANLRARGFRDTRDHDEPGQFPPKYKDPFKDKKGIPDITASELTLEALAGGILNHGALIVRNLVPPRNTASLVSDVDQVLDAQAAYLEGRDIEDTAPWFAPPESIQDRLALKRKFTTLDGHACVADSPRAMFRIMEVYRQLGLKELLRQYFGETPCLTGAKWVLRRVQTVSEENDWHQDGSFMGTDVRSVDLWISLSHCGGNTGAPGLDLIPKRLDHIVPTGTEGARLPWTVSRDYVENSPEIPSPVTPEFRPGDAVFFDHYNLHRTSFCPSMEKPRYAIECWFFASTRYAEDQIPILF